MEDFLVVVAGLGVLVSAVVNIGKTFGIIKDGQGEKIVNIMNPLVYLLFLLLPLFGVDLDWVGINLRFESAGEFLQLISGFLVSVGASKLFHKVARGTPIIGKSFSYDKNGK